MNHAGPAGQLPRARHCCQYPAMPAVSRRQEVGWVIGERRDDGSRDEERQSQAQQAIAQEHADSLALYAVLYEQARQQKHERHEEDVVEAGKE